MSDLNLTYISSKECMGNSLSSINGNFATLAAAYQPKGGGTNRIFFENDILVTDDYTITSNKNAMTAGPITIVSDVTVTVPDESTWTVI